MSVTTRLAYQGKSTVPQLSSLCELFCSSVGCQSLAVRGKSTANCSCEVMGAHLVTCRKCTGQEKTVTYLWQVNRAPVQVEEEAVASALARTHARLGHVPITTIFHPAG